MNDVNYYLSKGFEPAMAEYFAAGRKTLVEVESRDDFSLLLTYDNGEKRIYDIRPILENGGVFATLREPENFKRVYIDDCGSVAWNIDPNVDSNVFWNNKIDISSDTCYVYGTPV